MKVVALVPMRHSSERVPGKNYRPFAGKPLYHHIVQSLLGSSPVTTVVIDTDSPVIMEDAQVHFPEVMLLERPEHLRDGHISMNKVLLNAIAQVPADLYLQTHSTNPLLRAETITRAIETFQSESNQYDSLFSVTRLQTRLYDQHGEAINHDPSNLLRTQDLPPVYEENSNLYLFTKETLVRDGHRIGRRPMMFEIGASEAFDIDEELDFRMAEFLCLEYQASRA